MALSLDQLSQVVNAFGDLVSKAQEAVEAVRRREAEALAPEAARVKAHIDDLFKFSESPPPPADAAPSSAGGAAGTSDPSQ